MLIHLLAAATMHVVQPATDDLPSAAEAVDIPFEELWAETGTKFLDQGVGKIEARRAFAWSLLQRQLGLCFTVTKRDDVNFWRNWMRDERTASTPILRYILDRGDREFVKAKAEKRPASMTADTCSFVIASLIVEMKK